MMFENRTDAALQLIPELRQFAKKDAVVLTIPRGAVPMGYLIAKELGLPLDILLTKKIGHPANPELAIGSVSLEGVVVDPRYNIRPDYLDQETIRIRGLLQDRRELFMGNRPPVDVEGKTVIIVDDGIATGNTMLASVELVRNKKPQKIVIATPVASPEALAKLRPKVDEVVCLFAPESFSAVGQFYEDFSQVTDAEVVRCLEAYARGAKSN